MPRCIWRAAPTLENACMSTQIDESTAPEDSVFLLDQLSAHSDPWLGEEPRGLCLIARSAGNTIIAGLVGKTGWQYLEVSAVWVDEQHRQSGHASRLMFAAEAEAMRRGCRHARLDTFSFQALGFYQRLGYSEFGRLSGYAGRFDRHFLHKALGPQTPVTPARGEALPGAGTTTAAEGISCADPPSCL
jgi:ribosomal protein S18 acetylase RimI-like enzyme